MPTPSTVRLDIDRKNLIDNLRYAFSSRLSVIGELLQNARRAGARHVAITHDPEGGRLIVDDDGMGCADIQDFLQLARSGWPAEVKADEQPFGMGFLSALFAGDSVTVESRGQRIAFRSADALSFQDIAVEVIAERVGTRVEIQGFRMAAFEAQVKDLVRGFPVEVSLNGEALPRPHALGGSLRFEATEIGQLHLDDIHSTATGEADLRGGGHSYTELYLQGLPIGRACHALGGRNRIGMPNILHLDSRVFHGLMPDRNQLKDEAEAHGRILAFVRSYWQEVLRRTVPRLDPREVAGSLVPTLELWGMESLLDAVDYMPGQYLYGFREAPHLVTGRDRYAVRPSEAVSRADIASGKVVLVAFPLSEWRGGRSEGEDFADLMYAYLKGNWFGVDLSHLSADHWVRPYVRTIDPAGIERVACGPVRTADFSSDWTTVTVVSSDSYRLRHDEDVATGTDAAVFTEGPVFDEAGGMIVEPGVPVILLPRKCNDARVIHQMGSYVVDDVFDGQAAEWDENLFRRFVHVLRGGAPEKILDEILSDLDASHYDCLKGRSFRIAVTKSGRIQVALGRSSKRSRVTQG